MSDALELSIAQVRALLVLQDWDSAVREATNAAQKSRSNRRLHNVSPLVLAHEKNGLPQWGEYVFS